MNTKGGKERERPRERKRKGERPHLLPRRKFPRLLLGKSWMGRLASKAWQAREYAAKRKKAWRCRRFRKGPHHDLGPLLAMHAAVHVHVASKIAITHIHVPQQAHLLLRNASSLIITTSRTPSQLTTNLFRRPNDHRVCACTCELPLRHFIVLTAYNPNFCFDLFRSRKINKFEKDQITRPTTIHISRPIAPPTASVLTNSACV